eukprot:3227246-Pyramimonas_sp.AAC.1
MSQLTKTFTQHCESVEKTLETRIGATERRLDAHDSKLDTMQAEINELKGLLNAVRTETPPSVPPSAAFHRKIDPTILVVRTASLVAKEA